MELRLPEKCKILSGSMLKLIAVITMVIDHVGGHLVSSKLVLFSVAGHNVYLQPLMRGVGRWAFPIFAFLLIEGFLHTRSRLKYGISLAVFALISEIPWNLEHSGSLFFAGQNVFFTLLAGYLGLCVIAYWKKHPVVQVLSLIALCALSSVLNFDFAFRGFAFIILLYGLRQNEILRPFSALVLNSHWWSLSAFLPISLYNGKRGFVKGKVLKYAFYVFYPAHLLVIYWLKYFVLT